MLATPKREKGNKSKNSIELSINPPLPVGWAQTGHKLVRDEYPNTKNAIHSAERVIYATHEASTPEVIKLAPKNWACFNLAVEIYILVYQS